MKAQHYAPWGRSIPFRRKISILTIVFMLLTVAMAFGQETTSGAAPATHAVSGRLPIHVVPWMSPEERQKLQEKPNFAPPGAHLTYYGGPVISSPHVVVVFWGSGSYDPNLSAHLGDFYNAILNSTFWDFLTEYNTAGVSFGGSSSNQTLSRGQYGTTVTITPSVTGSTISDAQIQTEIHNQINAGHLPAPANDIAGNVNTIYMVYFPHGKQITQGGSGSCVAGGFCAYHGTIAESGSQKLLYAVIPDFQAGSGCDSGCGSGSIFQNETSVSSHELVEATTDADVGLATVVGPPLAWYDNTNGEIGDICNGQQSTITTNTGTWTVQQEFSNSANDCVVSTNRSATSLAVSAPASVQANVPFTFTVTAKNGGNTVNVYGGTVHITSSDGSATLPADSVLTSGVGTFQATLINAGSASVTGTDTVQGAINGNASITVTAASDLTVTQSHSGNFNAGSTGSYTITVSNSGGGATSGIVNLSDFLPTGLTASTMSGSGWSCNPGTISCSRSDALAAGGSYPAITLGVNVASDASGTLNSVATVNGGAELNTSNDSASDPTTIVGGAATMISPAPGSTLTGSSATFTWTAGTNVTAYLLYVGTALNTHDVFNGTTYPGHTSQTVNSIPTGGATLYVNLYSAIGGVWQKQSYTYTEFGSITPATITSPTPGSQLTGSSATFTWTTGGSVTQYLFWIGTAPHTHDLYYLNAPAGTTSANVTGLPTNAAPIYVTLYSMINGVWQTGQAYIYREAGVAATMTSPTPGSTLPGASVTFNWTAGSGVTQYLLYVGTTPRAHDVFLLSGGPGTTSATVNNIPTGGVPLYVTLFSQVNGAWQSEADTYTEAGSPTPAVITSPAPGSTLSGSAATFGWTPGSGATQYLLYVGTAPRTHDISVQNLPVGTTSAGVTGIPTTGQPLYVTLFSLINGSWSAGQAAVYTTGP